MIEELLKQGHEVVNFDTREPVLPEHKEFWDRVDISILDFPEDDFDIIYHLAAMPWAKVGEGRWLVAMDEEWEVNTVGTLNILQAYDAPIVFTSTANVYGDGRKFKEDSPMRISSPYGYSKAVAERVIELCGQPYRIFRLGTVVGPRGRCFPNRLAWCAVNDTPVKLFNGGDTMRDIVDVRDVVSGIMTDLRDGIYNLGSRKEVPTSELIWHMEKLAVGEGFGLDYSYINWKPDGYVPYSTLDTSKLNEFWQPRYKLEDTLESVFKYYVEEENPLEPPSWDAL